jgi:hypothetical protein
MKIFKQCAWWLFLAAGVFVAGHAMHMGAIPFIALGSYYSVSPNTGDSLAGQDPAAVRKIWQKGVDVFEQNEDFYAPMEGGKNAIIETVTDTSKGIGQQIRFEVMSGFYKEPHLSEDLFETSADFEVIEIDGDEMHVDFLRHGVRYTERMEEAMGMRGEIVLGIHKETGKWLGRQKTEKLDMMFLHKLPDDNVVFAGGKSLDTLVSSNFLKYDEILGLNAMSSRLGGEPGQIGSDSNGNPIFENTVIATTDALFSLDLDPDFRTILARTSDVPAAKTIFAGGYTRIKGALIKERKVIDHDGVGAIGSPLNPKARLGAAISAGTAGFNLLAGGSAAAAARTDILFTKYFWNYAYQFLKTDVLSQDALTHYVMIINPPNAPTDPNKWGMYSYTTGNNGNMIAITGRLGASLGGVTNTTLGGVTFNASASLGAAGNTETHPIGALVLPCNSKGQIFGSTLYLLKRAARRGYGKYRNRFTTQDHEGGFVMDRFVTSVFGQEPRKDRLHRVPGAFQLIHALQIAGVPTPTIV